LRVLRFLIFIFFIGASIFLGKQIVRASEYAITNQPLWKVGDLNKDLSFACRRGRFNQAATFRLSIGYIGKNGKGITGIAQKGWNLKDPKGLGLPGFTYHFFHDGLSNCRVYVAKTPKGRP
jgi:hypothetical protein